MIYNFIGLTIQRIKCKIIKPSIIDRKIKSIIRILNENDLITEFSCQGHWYQRYEDGLMHGYILFKNDKSLIKLKNISLPQIYTDEEGLFKDRCIRWKFKTIKEQNKFFLNFEKQIIEVLHCPILPKE